MKKYLKLLLLLPLILVFSACEIADEGLSDAQIADGLKEALRIGSQNASTQGGQQDGYFLNNLIKIPFPEDAKVIETTLRGVGLGTIVDNLILKLNRAAEDAAPQAEAIFVNAVNNMTITDAVGILHGADDAATQYLDAQTRPELYDLFKPQIESSLDKVGANVAWTEVSDTYNSIPFVTPVNTDLSDYTTTKALDGLFVLLAGEEDQIRKDVNARVTDLLKQVFGELDK